MDMSPRCLGGILGHIVKPADASRLQTSVVRLLASHKAGSDIAFSTEFSNIEDLRRLRVIVIEYSQTRNAIVTYAYEGIQPIETCHQWRVFHEKLLYTKLVKDAKAFFDIDKL